MILLSSLIGITNFSEKYITLFELYLTFITPTTRFTLVAHYRLPMKILSCFKIKKCDKQKI